MDGPGQLSKSPSAQNESQVVEDTGDESLYPAPPAQASSPSAPHCQRVLRPYSQSNYLDGSKHCTFCHREGSEACRGDHLTSDVWYGVIWPTILNLLPSEPQVIVLCTEPIWLATNTYLHKGRLVRAVPGEHVPNRAGYTLWSTDWGWEWIDMTTHHSREMVREFQPIYQMLGKSFPPYPWYRFPDVLSVDGTRGFWFHAERDELLFNSHEAFASFASPNGDPRRNYYLNVKANQGILIIGVRGEVLYPDVDDEGRLVQFLVAFRDLRILYLESPTGPVPRYNLEDNGEDNDENNGEDQTPEEAITLWLLDKLKAETERHYGTFVTPEIRFRTQEEFQQIVEKEGVVPTEAYPGANTDTDSSMSSPPFNNSPFRTLSERARRRSRFRVTSEGSIAEQDEPPDTSPTAWVTIDSQPQTREDVSPSEEFIIAKEQCDREKALLEEKVRKEEEARRNRLRENYKKVLEKSRSETAEWRSCAERWARERDKAVMKRRKSEVRRLEVIPVRSDESPRKSIGSLDAFLSPSGGSFDEILDSFGKVSDRESIQHAVTGAGQAKLGAHLLQRELNALRVEYRGMLQKGIKSEREEIAKISRILGKVK